MNFINKGMDERKGIADKQQPFREKIENKKPKK